MLSRVADSIYWLNRYIERAENVSRFIGVTLNLTLDLPDLANEQWAPLVMTTGDGDLFKARHGKAERRSVLEFLTSDTGNPNSILSCLVAARENARSVREIISSEMWECVNRFYLGVKDGVAANRAVLSPYDFFAEVRTTSHLFGGVMDATMSHGEGWHFGRLGRLLERADKTSRLVDVKYYILLPNVADVGTPFDNIQWSSVLRSASAYEMYRKEHSRITPLNVADFLILNRDFPRSMHYCATRAEDSLHAITGTRAGEFKSEAEKKLGKLRAELSYTDIADIMNTGLHEFLDEFQGKLNGVGEAVFETFFALRPAPQAMSRNGDWEQ